MSQTQIPGTERQTDAELDRLAEDYRQEVLKRVEQQKVEARKKADLAAAVKARIDEGKLQAPDEGEVQTVYRYFDDEGKKRRIKFGNKETVKVGADEDDDE